MSTRPTLRSALAVAAAVVCASLARADAPGGQYGTFDATNVVIFDKQTHLTWQRAAAPQQMGWTQAAGYCAALSLGAMTSGWRLPSYKELLTLVDESPHIEYESGMLVTKFIDSHAFGFIVGSPTELTPLGPYWSSSLSPADPNQVLAVDFQSGNGVMIPALVSTNVRCVHD